MEYQGFGFFPSLFHSLFSLFLLLHCSLKPKTILVQFQFKKLSETRKQTVFNSELAQMLNCLKCTLSSLHGRILSMSQSEYLVHYVGCRILYDANEWSLPIKEPRTHLECIQALTAHARTIHWASILKAGWIFGHKMAAVHRKKPNKTLP